MRDGLWILDADAHTVEPAEVFADWVVEDRPVWNLPETTPAIPCGDLDAVADQVENGFDAASYLRAMDAQGIDAAVLYPSMGLFVPYQPELEAHESAAACRSYNEWIADYCATAPHRLAAVGLVPLAAVDEAVAVAQQVADLGLVGAMVRPNPAYGRELGDAVYDPLYAELAEAGLVLAVHEGLGVRAPTIGSERFTSFAARHVCSHPMEQMAALAGIVLGGVLERHPSLHVAFLESGTGWLPYWLHRLDEHIEWLADSECAHLSLRATEYFARQCVISSDPDDELAAWALTSIGAEQVVWASDFPHPDARFPDAVDVSIADARAEGVSDDALSTMLWSTPRRFYGLTERFGLNPASRSA